jgi:5-methylcytosine-specific restriction endonuclease McrA
MQSWLVSLGQRFARETRMKSVTEPPPSPKEMTFPDRPIMPITRRDRHMDVLLGMLEYVLEDHAQTSRHYTPFQRIVWHKMYNDPRNKKLTPEARRERRLEMLGEDEWSHEVWCVAKNFWNHRCAACGRKTKSLHRDHLIPVASKDSPGSVPSNLIPLCGSCNTGKSAQDFATWWEETFADGDPMTQSRKLTQIIKKIHAWQDFCHARGWN